MMNFFICTISSMKFQFYKILECGWTLKVFKWFNWFYCERITAYDNNTNSLSYFAFDSVYVYIQQNICRYWYIHTVHSFKHIFSRSGSCLIFTLFKLCVVIISKVDMLVTCFICLRWSFFPSFMYYWKNSF